MIRHCIFKRLKNQGINTSRIGALMIVSQVLLFAFTGHWLYSQYLGEKETLKSGIERELSDTKQQVMDTMLVRHLINPILNNEKGFKIHMAISDDQISGQDSVKENKNVRAFTFVQTDDSGLPPELLKGNYERKIELTQAADSANNLLVKGVKLIYDEVKSSFNQEDIDEYKELSKRDTVLLKRLFSENLKKSKLDFNFNWVSKDSVELKNPKQKTLYFESRLFTFPYGAEIKSYRMYLLGKMFPQISFAIILLLLTSIAFYLSYSSLKNQMRLSALKNDFISNISHELKTPVSTVKVAIEALQDPKRRSNPEKTSEYLDIASLEITRLEKLIEKVLDTSTLEGRKDLIQPHLVDINLLIQEVIQSFQHRLDISNSSITVLSENKQITALVDKLHVQGVFINLIDNSIKYGKENTSIHIELIPTDNWLIIRVADDGPGIPEEYITKVFEKFFRAPNLDVHNVKGSGLGLSYASLVMHQHFGTIEVKNRKEGGCIFTLKFPVS